LENWIPIKFEPDVEREYAMHMLERFIPLARLGSIFGIMAFVGYFFWDIWLDPLAFGKTGPIRLIVVLYFSMSFILTFLPVVRANPKFWPYSIFCTYAGVGIGFAAILSQLPNGFTAGFAGFITGMVFVPAMVSGIRQASAITISYLAVSIATMAILGASQFEIINALWWVSGGVGFAIGFSYLLDVINRRAFHLERLLDSEKRRSEALLLNILPADIATRLKANEEPLADAHENVSVLFADLAGFTDISRKMSADELVNLLNDLFSRFDKLAEEHGAEKIKTIGDAYMVATGLKGSVADHAEKIADLALGMQKAFGEFRQDNKIDLKLRIGVHSGAVIAGVIGKQKFSYDLWGNTVNVASRMESEGVADQIQLSAETLELLSDRYQTTSRGEIQIKGHRPRATYLLEGNGLVTEPA
jgi:class 3 adenylate cyclase